MRPSPSNRGGQGKTAWQVLMDSAVGYHLGQAILIAKGLE